MRKDRSPTYVEINADRYLKISYWRLTTARETTYGAKITLHRRHCLVELLGWAYQGDSHDNEYVVTRGTRIVEKTDDLPRAACRLYDAR
jgi:hypothetical protein